MKLKLAILLTTIILMVGCTKKEEIQQKQPKQVKEEMVFDENKRPYDEYGEEVKSNDEVLKSYETINKKDLNYKYDENMSTYLFEFKKGIAQMNPMQTEEPLNDKKYKEVLQAFSFASEVNPIRVTYDEAIELVKKVLPDDIKKESETDYIGKEDVGTGIIRYTSSQGDFIVNLAYGFGEDGITYDKNNVVGITYLKQVV
ncbi:hypothetical protein [Romboutsia lituseburensis]|uniref:hypothetical protein n=1 Tax=Romboutsia lituseburensis TaxID=1537 RepID=UPI00215A93BC|nr:hypothetical protein [Romboutsia lituseburensis]MCR8743938.1 hypothetical protein [Romboutsia lituseburensis]